MPYAATLDANVLHPQISVDLLLRLADRGLFPEAMVEGIEALLPSVPLWRLTSFARTHPRALS